MVIHKRKILTITLNHIAEFSALVVSLILWKYIKKGKLKSLPFFLLFILLVELTGNYLQKKMFANVRLYNISIPIEYGYYFFLYYLHGGKTLRLFIKWSSFVLIAITGICFVKLPSTFFHSYVLVAGEVFIINGSCIFLYEQFQNTEDESLLKNYFFWLSSGLLLFNLGELAYFLFFPLIHANKWDRFDFLFKQINNSLLLLLYLSYILSIVVYKK